MCAAILAVHLRSGIEQATTVCFACDMRDWTQASCLHFDLSVYQALKRNARPLQPFKCLPVETQIYLQDIMNTY